MRGVTHNLAASGHVVVTITAGGHSLVGAFECRSQRILDVLNDASTDFLRVRQVAVFRQIRGECIAHLHDVTIPTSAVRFAALQGDKHDASLRQYAFVGKQAHRAIVVCDGHEMCGTVMATGTADPVSALGKDASMFFAVTDVQVSNDVTNESFRMPMTFVNKTMVSFMHVIKERHTSGEPRTA